MVLDAEFLLERLTALAADVPSRWLVAYSGGMDSTVLLHALAGTRELQQSDIVAVHINHDLHEDSANWDDHCRQFATKLDVSFIGKRVAVDDHSGSGPEAAAREARYTALLALVNDGDCLLSAHHEDDQAETLLLNLMRGSGLAGLAGIGAIQQFGRGRLLRPLLGVSAATIRAYAERHNLDWIDDPSNADTRFDRNFLRQEIVPALAARWPAVAARLRQSADLASEASTLLRELADIDIATAGTPERLDLRVMQGLSHERQRNALRQAVNRCGLPPAPATRLYEIVDSLIPAREDAQPRVEWPGAEIRRYRNHLYVMPAIPALPVAPEQPLRPDVSLELGPGMGQIALSPDMDGGISPDLARAGLRIRYRHGGEEIRPTGHDCTHKLKKLLQQEGIVPWMRERLPLLYSGDELVAVADLWIAKDCSDDTGFGVSWQHRSPLK